MMEKNVKKTHKKVKRQGLPRVTISRDVPLRGREKPKEQLKKLGKEQNIDLTLNEEQHLNKTKAIYKTEKKPENQNIPKHKPSPRTHLGVAIKHSDSFPQEQ